MSSIYYLFSSLCLAALCCHSCSRTHKHAQAHKHKQTYLKLNHSLVWWGQWQQLRDLQLALYCGEKSHLNFSTGWILNPDKTSIIKSRYEKMWRDVMSSLSDVNLTICQGSPRDTRMNMTAMYSCQHQRFSKLGNCGIWLVGMCLKEDICRSGVQGIQVYALKNDKGKA